MWAHILRVNNEIREKPVSLCGEGSEKMENINSENLYKKCATSAKENSSRNETSNAQRGF